MNTTLLAQAQRLHESGRLADAEAAYGRVLATAPRDFHALHGLGLIAVAAGRLDDGLARFEAAVAADANQADGWMNLSRALVLAGRAGDALRAADRALALRPGDVHAGRARAVALMTAGPSEEAVTLLLRAVEHAPQDVQAWCDLGEAQFRARQLPASEEAFRRALQLDATHAASLLGFGRALQARNRYEDAALVYERLWNLWPEQGTAGGLLLHCKMLICDWTQIDTLRQRIESAIDAGRLVATPFGMQGHCASPATLRRCAEMTIAATHLGRATAPPPAAPSHSSERGGERIRIGYVSGEFRHQATSILLTELLELHDRTQFEVVAFDNGWSDGSALRRRIEASVDALVPIRALDDHAAAEAVRAHGIDVLVNLNGFFGEARHDLFALRPAPVQVNWLGFPGTMGAPWMDYLLADRWVVPTAQRAHYCEAVATLPHCYQPNDRKRTVAADVPNRSEVGLPEQGFVFCCFNNTYKLTPEVFAVWMRLLKQVRGSVLWYFGWIPEAVANLRGEAQRHGVDPDRLIAAPFLPLDRHLARLQLADLFVDTWPYNAHTTGSDALWAGVPLVTCTGDTFPSRVGASLLDAVGLPELITHDLAAYEALALTLAGDPAALTTLRSRLQLARHSAALWNTPRLCAELESAFRTMTQRARAGLPPMDFAVPSAGESGAAGSPI